MNYKLSKEADNDLIDLYLHGFKTFGEAQTEKYYFDLEECIKLPGETPLMCRVKSRIYSYCANSSSWKSSYYLSHPGRSYFNRSSSTG